MGTNSEGEDKATHCKATKGLIWQVEEHEGGRWTDRGGGEAGLGRRVPGCETATAGTTAASTRLYTYTPHKQLLTPTGATPLLVRTTNHSHASPHPLPATDNPQSSNWAQSGDDQGLVGGLEASHRRTGALDGWEGGEGGGETWCRAPETTWEQRSEQPSARSNRGDGR
jgi:hypothetical protein